MSRSREISLHAPLVPYSDVEEREERQLAQELEATLAAQELLNQHLSSQQAQVDRLHANSLHTRAALEDALAENVAAEKLRAHQAKIKGAGAGGIVGGAVGVAGGLAAPITVPAGALIGGAGGYALGSLLASARHRALEREQRDFGQRMAASRRGSPLEVATAPRAKRGEARGQGDKEGSQTLITFSCWENQRYSTFSRGWDSGHLGKGERAKWWIESEGVTGREEGPATVYPEASWELDISWTSEWALEVSPGLFEQESYSNTERGWQYSSGWDGPWAPAPRWNSFVRKRRWIRSGIYQEAPAAFARSSVSSAGASAPHGPGQGPSDVFIQQLARIHQALGEGCVLLEAQGEQLREAEQHAHVQEDALRTTRRVADLGRGFHRVILSWLRPSQSPPQKRDGAAHGAGLHQQLQEEAWEFEGRDPTAAEQLTHQTLQLAKGAHLMGKELDHQNGLLGKMDAASDLNSGLLQGQISRVEKEL